jgi:hypothetical protein
VREGEMIRLVMALGAAAALSAAAWVVAPTASLAGDDDCDVSGASSDCDRGDYDDGGDDDEGGPNDADRSGGSHEGGGNGGTNGGDDPGSQ